MLLDRVRGHGLPTRTSLRDCAHVTVVYSADLTAAELNLDGEPEDPIPTVPDGDDDTDDSPSPSPVEPASGGCSPRGARVPGDGVPLDACVNLPVWVAVGDPVRS